MPIVPSENPIESDAPSLNGVPFNSFAQRASDAVSSVRAEPGTVLPPQFTKTLLGLHPELETCVWQSLNDAFHFYETLPIEKRVISSLFRGGNIFENFRFFTDDGAHYGYYRFPHLSGQCTDAGEYFYAVVRNPEWGVHINANLVAHQDASGRFSPYGETGVQFQLTVRHEIDHLVRHLISIFRNFKSVDQFRSETYWNPLVAKKAELNAFYHQANLAIRLKGAGTDIGWDDILQHHTGWSLSTWEVSPDYRGVVNHVRSIFITRNAFYNALMAKYRGNPSAQNQYAAIAPEGYAVFDAFCKALIRGFNAIESESEMEVFLSCFGSIGNGVAQDASGCDAMISKSLNPPPGIAALPSHRAFASRFSECFRK